MAKVSSTPCETEGVEVPTADELCELLARPNSYRERTSSVRCLETHISWLFLTDHFVYKLKKPVRFEFLDFSTVENRKRACEQEVELNRRLAPNVYLGMVPIVRLASGGLGFDVQGEPVEWVVKMHRLPAGKSLDNLLRDGRLSELAIDSVAHRLTQFYSQLPPVSLAVADYHQRIENHVRDNREALLSVSHHFDGDQVTRIHARQLRLLKLAPDLLANRVLDGRIVEGHGDLRPEHIFLTSPPVIIDCIEFSAEFRTLDVADELAFLSMECDALEANAVGKRILAHYLRVSGDQASTLLLDFYRAYRACVRAKVFALRADQVHDTAHEGALATAQSYLDLADQYVKSLGPPVVLVVRGLSGTGKSTIAEMIGREIGSPVLQTDVIRRELFPRARTGPDTDAAYNSGCYTPENRARVYREMHSQAELLVARGNSVVVDGTYLTQESRRDVANLARRNNAELVCIRCVCPTAVAAERIGARARIADTSSEARPDFPQLQRRDDEPDPPNVKTVSVDTSLGTVEPKRAILSALRQACLAEKHA